MPLRPIDESGRMNSEKGEHTKGSLEPILCLDGKGYVDAEGNAVHPYFKTLKSIDWSIFGTLTFDNPLRRGYNAESDRKTDFHGLLQVTCKHLGVRRYQLPYYRAMEWSVTDKCHYHFLIAQNYCLKVPPDELAGFLQEQWTRKFSAFDSGNLGIGKADVRPYDQAQGLRGVSYCLKRGKEFYRGERERFDEISPALMKLLRKQPEPVQTLL